MRPVDELELVVAPRRLLGPLVLAVADGHRLARERLTRVVGVEEELDVLPVALVGVVPVVEDVVEPVLQGELARVAGVGGDVRIDGRRRAFGDALRPLLVAAARVERVPGEVEVVLVEPGEIVRGRADLDQIGGIPWSTQRDRRLVEEGVDVDRLVRLAVPAVLGLGDEPHHRGIALGERGLVREVGRRARRRDEREHGNEGAEQQGRERVGINRDSSRADGGRGELATGVTAPRTRVYETTSVPSALNNSSDRPATR